MACTSWSISICLLRAAPRPRGACRLDYRGLPQRLTTAAACGQRPSSPSAARSSACVPRADASLLADTEAAEDLAEQLVRRERAGDLAEALVGEAEFFGEQVERGVGARGLRKRGGQVRARLAQGLHVARARDEQALGRRVPAGEREQLRAQRIDAGASAGRKREAGGGHRGRCRRYSVRLVNTCSRRSLCRSAAGRRASICASPAS